MSPFYNISVTCNNNVHFSPLVKDIFCKVLTDIIFIPQKVRDCLCKLWYVFRMITWEAGRRHPLYAACWLEDVASYNIAATVFWNIGNFHHFTVESPSTSNTTKSTFSSTRLHPDVEKRPVRPGEYCSSSATLFTRSVVAVMFFNTRTFSMHILTCFLSSGRNGTKAVMRCFWINSLCQSPPK